MPRLYVALYSPVQGNVKHWALYLEGIGIFQVVGDPMEFELDIRLRVRPQDSARYSGSVYIAEVDDTRGFVQVVRNTEISNDVVHWNCQSFVLDVLEGLNDDDILDDYDYQEAKDKLEGILDKSDSDESDGD